MLYYIREVQEEAGVQRTAGVKARDDVEAILASSGGKAITVGISPEERKESGALKSLSQHIEIKNVWDKALSCVQKGDCLVVQFPIINHTVFFVGAVKKVIGRGARVILLIHDLEILRTAHRDDVSLKKKIRLNLEERSVLKAGSAVIAHNPNMREFLSQMGINKKKIVSLGIFDYLIPDFEDDFCSDNFTMDLPVIIAGALKPHKAKYAYELPKSCCFNLYGVGYEGEEQENVSYLGSFPPDRLPFEMQGSFGLVWDGESAETCSGVYGEYLRINNPHKTSLYLAAGMPVIIWKNAALAEFIEKHRCGITVSSLGETGEVLKNMQKSEYDELKAGAEKMSALLRSGHFTKLAVKKITETYRRTDK